MCVGVRCWSTVCTVRLGLLRWLSLSVDEGRVVLVMEDNSVALTVDRRLQDSPEELTDTDTAPSLDTNRDL